MKSKTLIKKMYKIARELTAGYCQTRFDFSYRLYMPLMFSDVYKVYSDA